MPEHNSTRAAPRPLPFGRCSTSPRLALRWPGHPLASAVGWADVVRQRLDDHWDDVVERNNVARYAAAVMDAVAVYTVLVGRDGDDLKGSIETLVNAGLEKSLLTG